MTRTNRAAYRILERAMDHVVRAETVVRDKPIDPDVVAAHEILYQAQTRVAEGDKR